ncbi:SMC family ATPase [Leptolyngbya sp. NK1-12]|uniref:Nuclease SbcCD subunit C n=1 Tax=Leptolyngbya sp. NK1-12 TaxID=2547451 RepID=A0AA96WEI0_9CYAN|nr:SMC family ATPase [Leptolyngbya sp. NK1-12]WNZ23683.1 SMC family ATPase [Leptolyngbya sp. NK1-12]
MEILAVTLKNFKSHGDRRFSFQPGTNAICGENGAGKTSILEAIAWVLFNHRGIYKNEDLIRNGSGSAQVTVSFISNRDGRTYEVQRCTSKGYTIFDPQLGVKLDYRHIEDEIIPWLRQHLGVAPGTDLARLFANTIGVPQGTFTADFLQPPDRRKQIFDSILKVEEYRQTNQDLLAVEKYGRAEVATCEQAIAQCEELLKDWELLQARRQILSDEIANNEATLLKLQAELTVLQAEKDKLAQQAQQMQQLTAQLQQLTAQVEGRQQTVNLLQQAVQRSQQAVEICTTHRASYQAYRQIEATLQQLEQQLKQRQILWKQREARQQQLVEQHNQLTRLGLQLEALTEAASQLEALQPLVAQQIEWEQQQSTIVDQLNQLQAFKLEQQNLTRQLNKLQSDQTRLEQEIGQIQAHQAEVDQIPAWEQKRERLQEQLSRVEAAKQFEAELRQLVTLGESRRDQHQSQTEQVLAVLHQMQQSLPLMANSSFEATLHALQAGVQLNTDLLNALWRILADLSEQTSPTKLHHQLLHVKQQLEQTYQYRAELVTLDSRQTQSVYVQAEMHQLQTRLAQVQQALAAEPTWQQQRADLISKLNQLDNPKGRSQLLERNLQQHSALHAQYNSRLAEYTALQQQITDLDAQLTQFAEVETALEQQQQLRQTHQSGYLTYVQHQNDANQLAGVEAELQTATTQLRQLEAQRLAVQTEYEQCSQTYDLDRAQQIEAVYRETCSQADQIAGGLPQQRKLLLELDSQLEMLQTTAQKRDRAQLELKQSEKVRRFITFARKVYKEAGPRITERYVQTISREADRLFRELLNRPNLALEWTREYDILVQEGAHTRRLVNLSGGEQMCAALAVRLALLRVLADVDIAFFDEPTTNMDRPRRQSLAEAIANIKTFRQLFVISHDDTFEQVTENVILVEREV